MKKQHLLHFEKRQHAAQPGFSRTGPQEPFHKRNKPRMRLSIQVQATKCPSACHETAVQQWLNRDMNSAMAAATKISR